MDGDIDLKDKVIHMDRHAGSILDMIGNPGGKPKLPPEPPRPAETVSPPVPVAEDDTDPFPVAGDAYRAHSRPGNKPELMLGLRLASGLFQAFAYGDLRHVGFEDAGQPGGHPALVLTFVGVGIVRLEGRYLDTLFEAFRRQRIAWLWERPKGRDFAVDDRAVVITGIAVKRAE